MNDPVMEPGAAGSRSSALPSAPSADEATMRSAGLLALTGALLMALGAVLWQTSGTDLDAALATGGMAEYLATAAGNATVVANLSAWILGVLFLGAAGQAFVRLSTGRPNLAGVAGTVFATAVPLAIASFVAMIALVVRLPAAPSPAEVAIADVVGFFASRADWIATVLIVGAGPALLSAAGRDEWAPRWLVVLGAIAGAAGLATVVAMFTDALTGYGFIVVPAGLLWMFGASVAMLRS